VARVNSFLGGGGGGGSSNTGRMFAPLKPRSERDSAEDVQARLRKKLSGIPGISAFPNIPQNLQMGGRQSSSNYQYTLSSVDKEALYALKERFLRFIRLAKCEESRNFVVFRKDCLLLSRKGFYFRCKKESTRIMPVIEGFNSRLIAGCKKQILPKVQNGKGPHSIELPEAIGAPGNPGLQQHFGIALRSEMAAQIFQFQAKGFVIVNLPVIRDPNPTLQISHGLVSIRSGIEDGEAPVKETGFKTFLANAFYRNGQTRNSRLD
jgi:hypothetical protein